MPTSITSSGITFDDATTQTTSATKAGGIGTTQLVDSSVTTAKINNAAVTAAKLDGAQTGSAPIYGCRAWVNFDGTAGSTVDGEFRCTIRSSGNVSKVVRVSSGIFTIHFTTAMPDANFAVVGSRGSSSSGSYPVTGSFEVGAKTASTFQIATLGFGNTWGAALTNSSANDIAIFR